MMASPSVKTLIQCTPDRYGGLICQTAGFENQPNRFYEALSRAVEDWIRMKIRGVWFTVPSSNTELVSPLIRHGFRIHHGKEDYIMLTRWMPKDEPSMLPKFACTYIGVGGIVLDRAGNLLVVAEKYAHDSEIRWKLPGGHVESSEGLPSAVEREVFEETGIRASFRSIISMRHNLQYMFGCSDLYICCLLEPLTFEINYDRNEIAYSRWMAVDEFLADPKVYDVNKQLIAQCLLQGARQLPVVKQFPGSLILGDRVLSYDVYRVDVRAANRDLLASRRAATGKIARSSSLQGEELLEEQEIQSIIRAKQQADEAVPQSGMDPSRWVRHLLEEEFYGEGPAVSQKPSAPVEASSWLRNGLYFAAGVGVAAVAIVAASRLLRIPPVEVVLKAGTLVDATLSTIKPSDVPAFMHG